MNETDTNIIRMVDRACIILKCLYENKDSTSISALSKELELPKANVFRILYTMQQHGVVEKEMDTDLYRLGKELIKYGEKVNYDNNIVELSKHHMRNTAQKIGETINIGIEHDGSIITLHSEEGEKSVLVSRLIPVAELHCSSMGKLILSEMNEAKRQRYFSQELNKRTVNTIIDYAMFEEERVKILTEDMSFDREEYDYGLSCIATPVRDSSERIVAMLSVSGPTTRLEFKGLKYIIDELKKLTKLVENEMI